MAGDNPEANKNRRKLEKQDRTRKNKENFDRSIGKDKNNPVPGSKAWAKKRGLK